MKDSRITHIELRVVQKLVMMQKLKRSLDKLGEGDLGMRRPRRSVEPTVVGKSIWEPTHLSSKTQMTSDSCASELLQDGCDSFLWPLPGNWSVLNGRWIVKQEIAVVPILS